MTEADVKIIQQLREENSKLQAALTEAEDILRAIRNGEADAILVGDHVYSLRGAESNYRAMIEHMSDGIVMLAPDGAILYANQRLADLVQMPIENLVGVKLTDLLCPADTRLTDQLLKERTTLDLLATHLDGRPLPLRLTSNPLPPETGAVAGVIIADLSEHRERERLERMSTELERRVAQRTQELSEANAALRESEARFRQMVDMMPVAVLLARLPGYVIEYINPKAAALIGLARPDVIGKPTADYYANPSDAMKIRSALEHDGTVESGEILFRRPSGIEFWGIVSAIITTDSKGRLALTAIRDVTDQKQAEQDIHNLNANLERLVVERTSALQVKNSVFDASLAANSVADIMGMLTEVNNAFLRIWGYPDKTEVIGKPIAHFLQCPQEMEAIMASLEMTGAWEGDYTARRKDGSTFIAHGAATVLRNEKGKLLGYQSAVLDMTARRQAEEALRLSEERFRDIFNSTPASIWEEDWAAVIAGMQQLRAAGIVDFERHFREHPEFVQQMLQSVKILDVNPETVALFEAQDKADLLRSLAVVFATPDTLPGFEGELLALAAGATIYRTEMTLRTLRRHFIHVLVTMTFPGAESQSTIVHVGLMNVTARKQTEEQLRQSNAFLEQRTAELAASLAALQESEVRFQRIFTNNMVAMALWNKSGDLLDANDAFLKMIGYARAEMENRQIRWNEITPLEYQERDRQAICEVEQQGVCTPYEKVFCHKDGHLIPILIGGGIYDERSGTGVLFAVDLTERKRAEEEIQLHREHLNALVAKRTAALRASEIQLQAILESTGDGILAVDSKGQRVIKANKRFAELWRIPLSIIDGGDNVTLLNSVLSQLTDPDSFLKSTGELYHSNAVSADILNFKDGRVFERHSFPMINEDAIIGRVWSYRDVTERRQAEIKLAGQLWELQRWHNATLGREGRILELKAQVNELLAQLGRAPRYSSALGSDNAIATEAVRHPADADNLQSPGSLNLP